MATRYLLHFAHEHINFIWIEFLSLTSLNNCKFKLISKIEDLRTQPYILVELEDDSTEESLVRSAKGSYLLKGLYEVWARSNISLDDLSEKASKSPQYLSGIYAEPDQTFRVNCESYGSKLKQTTKVEWMSKMMFMETFNSRPNLSNPKQTYCIFGVNDGTDPKNLPLKEYYFGRQLTTGDRAAIDRFSLKKRKFIANTSMDPMLSLIAANTAKVKPNDIVYDPFVGSGSLLVAAAYKGAYVFGSDIDWLLLHGKSRPTRVGDKERQEGESVRSNLCQYNLQDRYLDVMISDVTRSPLAEKLVVDSIITDPPYGIRECSEKIGGKKDRRPLKDHKVKYPSKTVYTMRELCKDLLTLSVRHLRLGGRLIFYLPITKTERDLERFIPKHPSLTLIAYCEQKLAMKVSRLLLVMEKTKELESGDKVVVPQILSELKFRDAYFSKSEKE